VSTVLTADEHGRDLSSDEAQSRRLREQLVHAQRLAAMGTMATMIAHEFNNILTPLLNYAQYALQQDDPPFMRKALEKVVTNGEKASAICKRIMGFAAPDGDQGDTDVGRIIHEALQCLVRDPAKDSITVREQIEPGLFADIHPICLQQVMYNLIINARQAMLNRPGVLTLSARREGRNVKIVVKDTGCGIGEQHLPHIFDPFFSTKRHADRPDKRGIGLGLSISKELITEAGGSISVKSTPGQGTAFTILLPLK